MSEQRTLIASVSAKAGRTYSDPRAQNLKTDDVGHHEAEQLSRLGRV